MITNNPHLQKKRCSKKGLGRSIMRRITEIPETVSRQCSREEKDLVDHGVTKSTALARKNPPDSTGHIKPKEDSLRNRVFSLKKSHSTYDHVRDPTEESNSLTTESVEVITATENSLMDSLPGKQTTKKAPEKVEAVSTENVPLVCKSVSAHNLSADKKPLHPRTSVLQKSLSVIASAKEKTLGLTGKAQNEESGRSHKSQPKGKDGSKKHSSSDKSEHKDSHRKNSSHTEESKKTHKSGIMKQQKASQMAENSDVGAVKMLSKDGVDIEEVCPWEVYDHYPGTGLSESKVQKHVSIASSELEKPHPSQPKGKTPQKTVAGHQPSNQKSTDRYQVCPWESQEADGAEDEKKHLSAKAPGALGAKGETANLHSVAKVCAGEPKELPPKAAAQPTEKDYTNKLRDSAKNASSSPAGSVLPSDSSRSATSNSQPPLTSRVAVCPWEYETPEFLKAERSIALSNATSLSSNKTATQQK